MSVCVFVQTHAYFFIGDVGTFDTILSKFQGNNWISLTMFYIIP